MNIFYYIGKDDNGEDLFGIEVMGENVLQNMFTNHDSGIDDEIYDKSKASIGKIYKYKDDKWVSSGKHFFDYLIDNEKLSELIRYTYIGERHRYSHRNERYGGYNEWDGGYIAERKFVSKPSVYKKYLTLVQCINGEIKGFDCDKAKIKFYDDIDYNYYIKENSDFEKYQNMVKVIENELPIWNKINIIRISEECEQAAEKKKNYILDLYSRYIMDMIVNGLYPLCNKKSEDIQSSEDKGVVEIAQHIEYIKALTQIDSSEEKLGKPFDFEMELNQIESLITELKSELDDNEQLQFLKILARYVGSRIHTDFEKTEFGYIEALENLVEGLLDIPEECFNKNDVEIIVKGILVSSLEKLLKRFSYFSERKGHELHSDVGNKFRISFELLSEGEERFLDIITKINDSIAENNGAELLVLLLDEPDQSLHPEWARRFIDTITQVIESIDFDGNIQLVLSTHSPYLLSDILPTDVFLLERDKESRKLSIHKLDNDKKISCLGANIYDLMQNEFFMNNTVGEFATKKINSFIKRISKINSNSEDIQEIDYFIEQIGEPIIQKVMRRQLEEKKFKLRMVKNKGQILEMITNEKDREKVKLYLQMLKD